ncbi:MAG: peptide-methionine (S)-S-oxide reductase MsrA [Parcubacteria group bacterium]
MKHLLLAITATLLLACSPKTAAHAAPARTETAYFAGGCFWCVEHDMAKIPGVIDVVSGYAGGTIPNPTYENHDGYREAVKVVFDPAKLSYRQLVDRFWPTIDPTDDGGQFCDRGGAYRTAVWVTTQAQLEAAKASEAAAGARLKQGKMLTPIYRFTTFYPAEGYHQDFAEKNPLRYSLYRQGCGRDARLRQVWK